MERGELRFDDPRIQRIVRRFRECNIYTTPICVHSFVVMLRTYAPPEVKIHCNEPIPDLTTPRGVWDQYRKYHNEVGKNPIEFDPLDYEELGGLLVGLVEKLDEVELLFVNAMGGRT